MQENVTPGIYRHYKGGIYKVVSVAKMDDTNEEFVVFHSVYQGLERGEGGWWIRRKEEFVEEVDYKGKLSPRFKFVSKQV
ncbi:MAG TPA: DUF1653 domain-containing protein [Verrucomicrobiae bacterium]|nr:DUF1653 domain-containing protein [Verrucomicrobiae bacterium]